MFIGINKGWKYWGRNSSIKLHSSLGKRLGYFGKLKYMKDFNEKPSIYNKAGIKDYILLESYTPIRVYSE